MDPFPLISIIERVTELTEEPEELEFSNISDLGPGTRSVNLKIQAIRHTEEREVNSRRDDSSHRVCEVLVGDPSGTVLLTVWDDMIDQVKDDQTYIIKNGYTSLFRGNIRLNIGRYGEIEETEEAVESVNEENAVSDQTFDQPPRYRSSYGGGGGGGRGGGGRGRSDRRFDDRRGGGGRRRY